MDIHETPEELLRRGKTNDVVLAGIDFRLQAIKEWTLRADLLLFGTNGDRPTLSERVRSMERSWKTFRMITFMLLGALITSVVGLAIRGNPASDRDTRALQVQVWELQQEVRRMTRSQGSPEGPR